MTFIPSTPAEPSDVTVINDGWFPDLSTAELKARTGLGDIFGAERVAAAVRASMIDVNSAVRRWRESQSAGSLANVPAVLYGDESEKVILYKTGVYARARAFLLETTRDYDSTKSGHDRADALEPIADDWARQSAEALARMTGRPRAIVELI